MDIFAIRRARLKMIIDKVANGNVAVFAGRHDYSRSQISQYLSERYNEGRSIGERAARALEAAVGASAGWMDQPINSIDTLIGPTPDREGANVDFPAVVEPETGPLLARNIPVKGTLMPIGDELVRLRDAENDIGVRFLQFHSRDPLAYALLVRGNGMRPRIKSGECIVVEPGGSPVPGDDVLVRLVSGEYMLMQLLYARDREFTLGNLNEKGPTTLVFDYDIVSIELVLAIARNSTLKLNELDIS
jgi:hypothetical protein